MRAKRISALLVTTAALALAAAAIAPSAGAVITHLRHGKAVSYMPIHGKKKAQPFDSFFANLDYNGGPIMPSSTLYPIYWAPSGHTYPAGYKAGINRWLEDLAHDSAEHKQTNTNSVAEQYGDSAGHFASYDVHFGGEIVDTDAYPGNGCSQAAICLTDAQLQAELSKVVKAQKLPTDLEHMYMLLTPPGVEDCFEESGLVCSAGAEENAEYCAYHSNAPQSDGSELIYTNDPFVGEGFAAAGCTDGKFPNGVSDSALQGGLSHEHNEAITDPEPNSAWTDFAGIGEESADKCRTGTEEEFGTPLGKVEVGGEKVPYNQEIHGDKYWYQQEWSNEGSTCLQRLNFEASTLPMAHFTVSRGPTNAVVVNATGSTEGAGIHYNWQFNDGPFGPRKPVETTSTTLKHEFPSAGTYLVALTVFAANGASAGTAAEVTVPEPEKPKPTETVTTPTPAPAPPPPPPPPPPAPVLTGTIALPTSIAARKNGSAKINLTCKGTATLCSGELIVTLKQTVRVHGKKRTRTITIGVAKFIVATNKPVVVLLKLNATGKKLLKAAHGHAKGLLTLKQTGPAVAKGSVGVRVTLAKK